MSANKQIPSQLDQVERWAEYVLTHADWKKIHTQFIDAQFSKSFDFYKRLSASPDGRQTILELRKAKL